MKTLIILAIVVLLSSCCCPRQKVCWLVMDPYIPGAVIPLCMDKCELDKPEKERGYKTFNSSEEMRKFIEDAYTQKLGCGGLDVSN